jgi:hypothetical protein
LRIDDAMQNGGFSRRKRSFKSIGKVLGAQDAFSESPWRTIYASSSMSCSEVSAAASRFAFRMAGNPNSFTGTISRAGACGLRSSPANRRWSRPRHSPVPSATRAPRLACRRRLSRLACDPRIRQADRTVWFVSQTGIPRTMWASPEIITGPVLHAACPSRV